MWQGKAKQTQSQPVTENEEADVETETSPKSGTDATEMLHINAFGNKLGKSKQKNIVP